VQRLGQRPDTHQWGAAYPTNLVGFAVALPTLNLSRAILTWPIACLDEMLIDIMPLFVGATLAPITSL